jgi:hypothetical protein
MRKRFYKTLLILLKEKKTSLLYCTYISYIKGGTSFLYNIFAIMVSLVMHPSVHTTGGDT